MVCLEWGRNKIKSLLLTFHLAIVAPFIFLVIVVVLVLSTDVNKCLNGGTTTYSATGWSCACPSRYSGEFCQTGTWKFQVYKRLVRFPFEKRINIVRPSVWENNCIIQIYTEGCQECSWQRGQPRFDSAARKRSDGKFQHPFSFLFFSRSAASMSPRWDPRGKQWTMDLHLFRTIHRTLLRNGSVKQSFIYEN